MDAAWVGLIGVAVGSGLTIGYSAWHERKESKEKYRVMLYEKRLEVYQKAYYHVQQLLDPLLDWGLGYGTPVLEHMAKIYRHASDFYDSECLYLDDQSRAEMTRALREIKTLLEDPGDDTRDDAFKQLLKAQKAIEDGIGTKHIEEHKRSRSENKADKGHNK